MKVWIVAQVKSNDGREWELEGVYSSEESALAACVELSDCVWTMELDESCGRHTQSVGTYPLAVEPSLPATAGAIASGL